MKFWNIYAKIVIFFGMKTLVLIIAANLLVIENCDFSTDCKISEMDVIIRFDHFAARIAVIPEFWLTLDILAAAVAMLKIACDENSEEKLKTITIVLQTMLSTMILVCSIAILLLQKSHTCGNIFMGILVISSVISMFVGVYKIHRKCNRMYAEKNISNLETV